MCELWESQHHFYNNRNRYEIVSLRSQTTRQQRREKQKMKGKKHTELININLMVSEIHINIVLFFSSFMGWWRWWWWRRRHHPRIWQKIKCAHTQRENERKRMRSSRAPLTVFIIYISLIGVETKILNEIHGEKRKTKIYILISNQMRNDWLLARVRSRSNTHKYSTHGQTP